MNKSLLTASVLGVISAVASSAAYADYNASSTYCKPGFYAGLEAGRGDTFYHNADVLGPASAQGALTSQNVDDRGLAGRFEAGYQFNPYFASEMGYTQYGKTEFTAASSGKTFDGNLTQHAIDLVAKATLPLENGFGAYVKAGGAYVTSERSINETNSNTLTGAYTLYTKTYQGVRFVEGAGLDWTIPNTSWDLGGFYNRMEGTSAIKTATLWGLEVNYKFA